MLHKATKSKDTLKLVISIRSASTYYLEANKYYLISLQIHVG